MTSKFSLSKYQSLRKEDKAEYIDKFINDAQITKVLDVACDLLQIKMIEHYEDYKIDIALSTLYRMRKDPENAKTYLICAISKTEQRDAGNATLQLYSKLFEQFPDVDRSLYEKAIYLADLKNRQHIRADFQLKLADILATQGQKTEAVELINDVIGYYKTKALLAYSVPSLEKKIVEINGM